MKNMSLLKKCALGVLASFVLVAIGVLAFVTYEIDHMLGGNTEVIDNTQFKTLSGRIAITNVNVLSSDSSAMKSDFTVLINENLIEKVGKNILIPKDYRVIDGYGQFLIPGLIDSHVHIKKSKNDLLLYLANGVTHIGEMTGLVEHFEYKKEVERGALGPTIYIASPKVSSQKGVHPTLRSRFEKRHQNYLTPVEGRRAVRKYQEMGFEAIKISSDLSKDIYLAINDEAQKLGIPVIGHLPVGLGMTDLYASGQSQLAHIDSITLAELNEFGGYSPKTSAVFLELLRNKADQIAAKLKENNIVVASTVWLHKTRPLQDFNLANFLKTINLEYQNPGWVEGSTLSKGWLPGNNSYENPHNLSPESILASKKYYDTYNGAIKIITQALVRNNVTIVAGTDAHGAAGVIAGFSLHKEMDSLNQLGLTTEQVLRAATSAPAKWMGLNTGKIEPGYRADLLLLRKNPLQDIRNTRTISAVMANGLYLDRIQLNNLLKSIKEANSRSRKVNIDEYL